MNNLRISEDGETRALTPEERELVKEMPYTQASVNFAQIRKKLDLPESAIFNFVRYRRDKSKEDCEKEKFFEASFFHKLRKIFKDKGLSKEWDELKTNTQLLDEIGTTFSLYEVDDKIREKLKGKLADNLLEVLIEELHCDKFIELSLLCLSKILPLMEEGLRYDEAVSQVYGKHSNLIKADQSKLLPVIESNEIRNPVVLRTLTQTRKVINAIIRQYGSPARVHIETGRELGKSYSERSKIQKEQDKNRKARESAVENFKKIFGPNASPNGKDLLKWRLYEQQCGKCLYSGKSLDLHRLIEPGYVEIDHALPFSRTWDDSQRNKVLVLAGENQNKGNKTPFEWLDGSQNSQRWREFEARVRGSLFSPSKKEQLLCKKLEDQGFIERNLNDTRYIARKMLELLESLQLTGKGTRRVFASNGQITAFLRHNWGLKKDREANDRHHALDAVVVACSTPSMQQKITRWSQGKERNPHIDLDTGEIKPPRIPKPWEHFRTEVKIRVFNENPQSALAESLPDRPYAQHQYVKPLICSRMPRHKMSGQGHLETIKSAKRLNEGIAVKKVKLQDLKLTDLENMVNRDREIELYEGLKSRLEAFNNDPKKAFNEPFYKKGGQPVKSVRVEFVQKTGVLVHKETGIADNASIVRVDVFEKGGKFYLIPIYTWQVAKGILPNKAIEGESEDTWREIDESFNFQFSLRTNDYVKLTSKERGEICGYFVSLDRANARIRIRTHDRDTKQGEKGDFRCATKNATSFEKYRIDVLGKQLTLCRNEIRQPVR